MFTKINGPEDLRGLTPAQLEELASDIREYLIESVSKNGGHLGPNLGVIELTIGIHRVFDSPRDTIVFDTGHQSYVHKLLTGRTDFTHLREAGGVSGYPSRSESEHDVVENSHASTSLSWAHGIIKARQAQGETDRRAVAIIGDGALTGGMAWEALNNIAADDVPLTIVVNDNERSYAPTIGGLAQHLSTLRTNSGYEWFLAAGKQALTKAGPPGRIAYDTLHGVKKGIKDIVAPQGLFEDLGLKYIGPVDGHDIEAVEKAMQQAADFGGPVIVHVITRKGNGYAPARENKADQFHAVGKINPVTGEAVSKGTPSWTSVFADEMVNIGKRRPDVVGITAAMLIPVGLHKFQEAFPERVYDVGIAEQHAVTLSSGLSYGGLHPVVSVYSTFLTRAFDQVLFDAALHGERATYVLDRSGITGPDGPSHHGIWDLSLMNIAPNVRVCAPRDGETLVRGLNEAVDYAQGPTVVRYPKGPVPQHISALRTENGFEVLYDSDISGPHVLLVGIGAMAAAAVQAAEHLAKAGIAVKVVDPVWVLPVPDGIADLAKETDVVVTVEDGMRATGVGSRICLTLQDHGVVKPTMVFGVPDRFIPHAERGAILDELGLTAPSLVAHIQAKIQQLSLT